MASPVCAAGRSGLPSPIGRRHTTRRVSSRAANPVRNPPGTAPRRHRRPALRITARHVQVCLGVLWLLDGALQFQPFMYTKGFFAQIVGPAISGQPAPIASPITWAVHLAEPHQFAFNTVFALTQVAIGIGILIPRTAKAALAVSFGWGLGVWWLGEGLGQLFTDASPLTGAPGAALLYVLIGVLVWPARRPRTACAAAGGPFGELGGKMMWALLWVGMAALWVTPGNTSPDTVRDALNGASGAAGALRGVIDVAARAATGRGTAIAVALAVVSAAVGVGVFSRHRNVFLAAGIAISITYWLFGQALGGITTGTATDPNAGPLFVLLALALMPAPLASPLAHDAGRATVEAVPRRRPDPTSILVSSIPGRAASARPA